MSEVKEVMNKATLAEKVTSQTTPTKKTSEEALDAITSIITDALARRDKVTLVGFGTFQVIERKARRGGNPWIGQSIEIPAKKVPGFRPGKGCRENVE